TDDAQISDLISDLRDSRTLYAVTYESHQAQVGPRRIPVSAGGVSAVLQYEKDVLPPAVEIVSSDSDFNIVRNQYNATNDAQAAGVNFDTPAERLRVRVTFPDGIERIVTQATLYIDETAQPAAQVRFDPDTHEFTLN